MHRRIWLYALLVCVGLLAGGSGADQRAAAAPGPAEPAGLGALPPRGTCDGLNHVSSPNVGGGNNYLAAVAAAAGNDVWAVGYAANSTLTTHWDGSTWSVVPSPSPGSFGSYLLGATALAAPDVWGIMAVIPAGAGSQWR